MGSVHRSLKRFITPDQRRCCAYWKCHASSRCLLNVNIGDLFSPTVFLGSRLRSPPFLPQPLLFVSARCPACSLLHPPFSPSRHREACRCVGTLVDIKASPIGLLVWWALRDTAHRRLQNCFLRLCKRSRIRPGCATLSPFRPAERPQSIKLFDQRVLWLRFEE